MKHTSCGMVSSQFFHLASQESNGSSANCMKGTNHESRTQSPEHPNLAYELIWHTFLMLKDSPKYLLSKTTTCKKRWLLNKIRLTWEAKTALHCKEWWAASLFILFQSLFKIIAQSAHGTANLLFWMYVDVVRQWLLLDFLHFGVLSSTEKGTKWAYQPNLAVLGLSSAFMCM